MDGTNPALDNTKAIILAAICGSLISMNFISDMSGRQRLAAIPSGVVMAYYGAPLIANLLNEEKYVAPLGFLVGLFGMSICAAIFRAIKRSDLWGLVRSRFSGQEEQP